MMNVLFVSLGCDKNTVDSEHMLALLLQAGYNLTDDETQADIAIVNTCCFIHDAKEESIETILELASYKKTAKLRYLVLAGCLAQRYAKEMETELPEVDAVIGTSNIDSIVSVVDELVERDASEANTGLLSRIGSLEYLPKGLTDRVVTTGTSYAYLKIAEGCNKRCTYCIIPYLRGNYRSVPMEEILESAEKLAADGYRELILVAQETTVYGRDLYGTNMLVPLLRKLSSIEGIQWIRLLYCYPEEINDDLIEEIATNPKVCHYLDMPIQHCSDTILKRMGRRTDKQALCQKIAQIRRRIPDMVLRTTLITGFPGETEEDHAELLAFVDDMEFERLGAFPYSPEDGTKAAEYPDQVPEALKKERQQQIMELQQEVSYDNNRKLLHRELTVLVEGYLADEQVYVGRSYREAPQIDGYIFIHATRELYSGEYVKVRITETNAYDLVGIMVDPTEDTEEEEE